MCIRDRLYVLEEDGSMICGLRGNDKYWYHMDSRGSITNVLDNEGSVVKSYEYDAYGNTQESGSFENIFAYTGAVVDEETGLYYMNARYYEPVTGRFTSQDSFRGEGEAFWHLYLYCDSDPVNFTDPTGHAKKYIRENTDLSYRYYNGRNNTTIIKDDLLSNTFLKKTKILLLECIAWITRLAWFGENLNIPGQNFLDLGGSWCGGDRDHRLANRN